jgi:hypothetical protein
MGNYSISDLERIFWEKVLSGELKLGLGSENDLITGEETMPRRNIVGSMGGSTFSGSLRLTYFTAKKTQTLSQISIYTGTVAAGATPTIARMGLYKVETNNDLTLIASTPNDTTLFAAATTFYTKSFSAPVDVVRGQRYAFGILIVSGATVPTFYGYNPAPLPITFQEPKLAAGINGQSDLPSTVANGSLNNSAFGIYAAILP